MSVVYNKEEGLITLHTLNTTYQMKVGQFGHLYHVYYGKKAEGDMSYLLTFFDRGSAGNPYEAGLDTTVSMDSQPMEYPCYGNGDYRSPAFSMKDKFGVYGADLRFKDCRVETGKYSIPGLPAVYAEETEADTVIVTLVDARTGVEVELYYGVVTELDVITRSARIKNAGTEEVTLTKAYSAGMDFLAGDFDVIHFHGRYSMEKLTERVPVMMGNQSFGSRRGISSYENNPFVILCEKTADEDNGMCYGMNFLYSGNFRCEVEKEQFGSTRFSMGIQDEMFEYPLAPGETFYAPEVAISCAEGLTALSHNYHKLLKDHVCRGPWRNKRRPILINNWEATYFKFNGEKILNIAKQASELGVEMLVLDDGWFGKREDDCSGLGDWFFNEEKMGCSLHDLVEEVNKTGMKFGIWIEPEMISEDSDLYREHPEWAFELPGRKAIRSRHQLCLDFSRRDVQDYIFDKIAAVIESANIEYVKMDFNRSMHDIYTNAYEYQNQGKILYECTLGIYRFLEKLLAKFPNLLLETCAGGGGRYDAGMLYYSPQIWASDNTDAIERLQIQYGSSFGYPTSSLGSHVSAVPNHQTGRITSMKTRAVVAMSGSFGYELDLNIVSDKEKEEVKEHIALFKKYWDVIHEGEYYRLSNPMELSEYAAWEFVSEDKSEALLNVVTLQTHGNAPVCFLRLKGIDANAVYVEQESGKEYAGSALLNAGLPLPRPNAEYLAMQMHFVRK